MKNLVQGIEKDNIAYNNQVAIDAMSKNAENLMREAHRYYELAESAIGDDYIADLKHTADSLNNQYIRAQEALRIMVEVQETIQNF